MITNKPATAFSMKKYPPRPAVTDDMKRAAATELVNEQVWPDACIEDIVSEFTPGMDGFDLAKNLDKWKGWSTSRSDMEALDDMETKVDELLRAAEKTWVSEYDVQPPLPIGTRVKHRHVTGVITGICDHWSARYLVKEDGQDDESAAYRRVILTFEAAEACVDHRSGTTGTEAAGGDQP